MRNPLRVTTLQGSAITTALWFGLAFVGVDGLVTPWLPEHGVWYWISAALWLHLPALYVLDLFRVRWVKWMTISLGLTWGTVQYINHLHGLFFPGSPEAVARYYEHYQTLFLVGPFENRIVPDLYHIFLDMMILTLTWIGWKRVAIERKYKKS